MTAIDLIVFPALHNAHIFVLVVDLSYPLIFFSDENLQNDHYLISLMDDQGWVPISTIADFKRVCNSLLLSFYGGMDYMPLL